MDPCQALLGKIMVAPHIELRSSSAPNFKLIRFGYETKLTRGLK